MALRWIEGFDWIGTGITDAQLANILAKRYAYVNVTTSPNAIITDDAFGEGQALSFREAGQWIETPALVPSDISGTWVTGFRVRFTSVATDHICVFTFINSEREQQGALWLHSDGTIYYRTEGWHIAVIPATIRSYRQQSFYIEVKVYFDNSVGTVEIRINGETVLSETGLDTEIHTPNGCIGARWYSWGSGDSRIDDMYVAQGAGADFLGPLRVFHLKPDGDTADEQWTLSGGSDSYALVDENEPVDDDTTYLSGTTGQKTLFTYEDVPAGLTDVHGVQLCTSPRQDDVALDLIQQVKSGGTEYPRPAQNIASATYTQIQDIMETDPDTSAAWIEANLNAVQFGVEVD